jgi:hypothetical protein
VSVPDLEEPSASAARDRLRRLFREPRESVQDQVHILACVLSDPELFSALVIRIPLRNYQLEPLRAILDSVLNHRGFEFLLIFPRQSGKNEAVAQLLAYLLNLYQRVGGNIVYGAIGNALGMGVERLEERLENAWNAGQWTRKVRPLRRCLGHAAIVFISSHPTASARGQTAHHLLVIDETQDQDAAHIESVFTPMRAANNATALYIGTVKVTTDFLWTKKLELERETARDGHPRVYLVPPETVTAENPAYRAFLDAQVARYGRHHPIVASEYFLEPIDGTGGLFDARRRALMRGIHLHQLQPTPGELYIATLDAAGEDEAATDPIARLAHPGRDYTVAHVFQVSWPPCGAYAPGPTYKAVDIFLDHGSKHFEDLPGRPALVHRLAAWLEHWTVAHLVADSTGVGQGLVSWLGAALGPSRVSGFTFAPAAKANLGSLFLSLVETGRFRYWTGDEEQPGSHGWWFWQQVAACTYELPPEGRFDRDLRWSVPDNHKSHLPTGPQLTHDDRLLSAALVAEADRLIREAKIVVGVAGSAVIAATDPLAKLSF